MIVRLGMAPRRAGSGFEEFQSHWRSQHADVASRLPGLRRYVQFPAILTDGRPLLPYPGFDACSALVFDSVDEMDASFSSDIFRDTVQADERAFVDKTRFCGLLGEQHLIEGTSWPATDRIVLMTLWRTAPGGRRDDLLRTLSEGSSAAAERTTEHLQIVADPAAHDGRFPAACDAVDVRGYVSVDDALADLRSSANDEWERLLAGSGHAVGRHIARPVDVPLPNH